MNKEDRIAVFLQDLKDIKSSLQLIQIAAKNEFEPPLLSDISNSLEILLSKYSKIIKTSEDLF